MTALLTAIQVAAERRRAAVLNRKEDAEVKPRQPGSALLDEAVAMRANDIGHLVSPPSRLDSSALSSGVPAAFR
jgi:hypothetical protein